MPGAIADRNLLFAVVALQNEFVNRDQLVELLNQWSLEKQTPIGAMMARRQLVRPADLQILERLVDHQLEKHNSVEESLGANSASMDLIESGDELQDNQLREILNSLTEIPSNILLTRPEIGIHVPKTFSSPGGQTPPLTLQLAQGVENETRTRSDASGCRFSVVRSHAKGGLGEVFVARDHELQRDVALKEIQWHLAANGDARSRFELEACITGGLEHPGVVPVYGFGHYPDGRPFYAMRFIRGESMKEEIARFHKLSDGPTPGDEHRIAFRKLLRRFVDCCNAIGYAHSRGILHRDIKPANIMLGKYGETLVVDWGLAKTIGRDDSYPLAGEVTLMPSSGGSGSATLHGSMLGTPAYMSPEQAAGDVESLTPASDIYSLGSTLYMLITGDPPYPGRHLKEVIEAVKANRFRPPRDIRPNIPRPLNAICLKAMSLEPADRYRTALDLAGDIERFLGDEPVAAYHESAVEKTGRWLRRHRMLASAIGGISVAVGIASFAWMLLIHAEQERTAAALQRVTVEERKTSAALESETMARQQTRVALNTITDELVGELMSRQEQLTSADEAFFSNVLQQFEQFTSGVDSSTEQINILADGYFRVGNLQRRLGKLDEAEKAFASSVKLWTQLVTKAPIPTVNQRTLQQDLAAATANLGLTLAEKGDDRGALERFASAAEMLQRVVDAVPDAMRNSLETQPVAVASGNSSNGFDVDKPRLELARLLGNSANTRLRLDRSADVSGDYKRALSLVEEMMQPENRADYLQDHARLLVNYGGFLSARFDSLPKSTELYRSAIGDLEELVANGKGSRTVRQELALTRNNLGQVLQKQGLVEEALNSFQIAVRENSELVSQFPGIAANLWQLGRSRLGLATTMAFEKKPTAGQEFTTAISTLEQLNAAHPNRPQFRRELATALDAWGQWSRQSDSVAAKLAMHRALEMRRELAAAESATDEIVGELIGGEINLANFERVSGNYPVAAELYSDLLKRIDARAKPPVHLLRQTLFGLGDSLVHTSDYPAALVAWERLCKNPADPDWARFELQRAICMARTGKPDEGTFAAVAVAEQDDVLPVLLYDTACCFAVAAEAVGEQDSRFIEFQKQGLAMLQRAKAVGFLEDKAMKTHIAKDGDLKALHALPEFRKFCQDSGIDIPPVDATNTDGN